MYEHGISFRNLFLTLVAVFTATIMTVPLPVRADAKSVTMYVIASTNAKRSSGPSEVSKYSYTSNGLLAKRTSGNKTLDRFTYVGKRMATHWKDGGDGMPSNLKFTYKNGKLVKSYDTINRNTAKFALNKKKKVTKIRRSYGSTSYNYDGKGRVSSYKYDNWSITASHIAYDKKGNVIKTTNYWNDDPTDVHITTHKNTYKSGRLVKVVAKTTNYKSTVTIKYKKIKVPASYKTAVKRQQASILRRYASDIHNDFYGLPLGSF